MNGSRVYSRANSRFRASEIADAPALTSLAMRSKAYWGYDEEFMELCREELSWSADEILAAEYDFQSCFLDAELIGFYALEYLGGGLAELEALFVEPLHIGSGIGRCMLEHAKTRAAARGVTRIIIQGDPHAERFYRAAGALSCGSRASGSIPGRLLPLFELRLDRPLTDMEIENERNHLG